ncbi:MAG TPA: glycosyltransferase family 9 protein [Ignavibacteria bacterium]|jgi:heptosyltransferase-2
MGKFDKSKVNKILVIKPAAIGDVLLSTPVIENLRHNFPDAEINFLTQKYCKEVLTDNPFLTKVLTYDLKYDSTGFLIKHLSKQNYDLVIDLFGNPRTAIITYFVDAKYRVGYKFNWRRFAYNIKVDRLKEEAHNIEFNLNSLRRLGLEIISKRPRFILNAIHKEFAEIFFDENNLRGFNVIGINPSGTWPTKVWYKEKFIELGKKLSRNYKVLIFWGREKEKKEAEIIKEAIGENAILIPEVNLKYMGALMEKCDAFITNDTGPMHIAWVLGVNTVAIFGPTNPKLQGPLSSNSIVLRNESLKCLGCNLTCLEDCPYQHKCMTELGAEEVYHKLMMFLNSGTKVVH